MTELDRPLTAAIVGLSWIGADPAGPASDGVLGTAIPYSHASAYAAVPAVGRLVGCDPSESARAAFEQQWRDRFPDVRAYADLETMLGETEPDVVSVVTPDHLHVPILMTLLESGVDRIFCEKPIALDLDEADRALTAAARSGATVSINYTRRWMPDQVEARALIRAGAIGSLSQVIMQLGGPRAMLFRNLTHSLDLMSYFAEAEPLRVTAELEDGFEDYGTGYQGDGQDPSKEPGANIYVHFENGVRAYLAGQKSMVAGDSTQLVGSTGRIIIDAEGLRIQTMTPEGVTVRRPVPRFTTAGMTAAVLDLLASHRAGRATASPPHEARKAVAISVAALKSQAAGGAPITVAPLTLEDR